MINEIRRLELCKMIHDNAVAHGWWDDDVQRDMPTLLTLIMSELGEAVDADRAGNPPSEKAKGFSSVVEELADVWIRCADVLQHVMDGGTFPEPDPAKTDFYGLMCDVVDGSPVTLDDAGRATYRLTHIMRAVEHELDREDGNILEAAILAKHEYNKGRPMRHGKRY